MTDDQEIAIFVKDALGRSRIMVNLTFVADVRKEQKPTEHTIKELWLRPQ